MTLGIKKSGITEFMEFGDERGSLVSLEGLKNIPFEIKRVYYIYNTKSDAPRGFHAMKDSLQMLVCVSGSCDIILDDGKSRETHHLKAADQGLFIDKLIWHELHNFTEGCVLMVLSDYYYREEDNIREYGSFLEMIKDNEGDVKK